MATTAGGAMRDMTRSTGSSKRSSGACTGADGEAGARGALISISSSSSMVTEMWLVEADAAGAGRRTAAEDDDGVRGAAL